MVHFLTWFKSKKQRSVLQESLLHLEKVLATVIAMEKSLKSMDKKDELKPLLHEIARSEHEADNVLKQLVLNLAKGELVLEGYRDLMEFIHVCDSIADYAHSAGRYLALFNGKCTSNTQKIIIRLGENSTRAVNLLIETVKKCGHEPAAAIIQRCMEIEKIEEESDDLRRECLMNILHDSYSPGELLILHDLIEAVEDVCDMCEVAAGRIKILSVKL